MEHRHGERIPVDLPAVVHLGKGRRLDAVIGNLSCGGAFLRLPARDVAVKALVKVEFCLPSGEPRQLKAFVVQRQVKGIGVMFENLKLAELLPFMTWVRTRSAGNAR